MLKLISGDTLLKIGQAMPVRAGKECNRAWVEADSTYLYSLGRAYKKCGVLKSDHSDLTPLQEGHIMLRKLSLKATSSW